LDVWWGCVTGKIEGETFTFKIESDRCHESLVICPKFFVDLVKSQKSGVAISKQYHSGSGSAKDASPYSASMSKGITEGIVFQSGESLCRFLKKFIFINPSEEGAVRKF
jgi:hypothetical protein